MCARQCAARDVRMCASVRVSRSDETLMRIGRQSHKKATSSGFPWLLAITLPTTSTWSIAPNCANVLQDGLNIQTLFRQSRRNGRSAMTFIPTTNHMMLTALYGNSFGTFGINRFFLGNAGGVTEDDLQEASDVYKSWFDDHFDTATSNQWSLQQVTVRDMTEEEGIELVDTVGLPLPGTNTSATLPLQVSATVTWQTGLVGRSARGRTYIVGVPAVFCVGDVLTSDAQEFIEGAYNTLMEDFATAGHAIAVVSFVEAGVPRTAGRPIVVSSVRCNFPLATQRRRLT